MPRLLSGFLPLLMFLAAYAQAATPEAPTESASPVTVILFLVLFIGSCIGFAVYVWWEGRKKKQASVD